MGVLKKEQEALLKEERRIINDLQMALVKFGEESEDEEPLRHSIQQLDELFLLVVVGEFNSGKSAIINALLGQRVLEEGVIPTTTQIHQIRYGKVPEKTVLGGGQTALTFPIDFLSEMTIVDTPGTNAIIRKHETITAHFVPRSDLVLFVTSADRTFTESERAFLEHIRDWGKKVVFLINKIDILESDQEIAQVESYVRENAHLLLGVHPEVFPISARGALRAKQGESSLWEKSRFAPFERYIHKTLDESSRLRLKFLNPLGVGSHLVDKYLEKTDSRMDFLKTDFDLLADVETQLAVYREDMHHNFSYRMGDIENILLEMEKRGQIFFDEIFRLGRVFDLLSKTRVQQEFERQVVSNAPQRIEEKVTALIDWMVEFDLRQWQAVTEHLAARRREHRDRIMGDVGPGSLQYDRERLIDEVGREARRVVESYDKSQESKAIAEHAQLAVTTSAALGAGALGLGALVTVLATTAVADVTGVVMASVIAALGLFIIPAKRRQGKMKLIERIAGVRTQLIQTLRSQFEKEINHSIERIQEAIAPYTRFIRAERGKMLEMESKFKELKLEIDRLKGKLEKL
ncbi:MAG: dynamin family protein [Thermodesulfobacteriota bacterium]|jgi:small GTP-binding protein